MRPCLRKWGMILLGLFLFLPLGGGSLADSGVRRVEAGHCCLSDRCKCGMTNHCSMPGHGNMAACRCAPGASPFLAAGSDRSPILQAVPHRLYLAPPVRKIFTTEIFHPPKIASLV